MSQRHRAGRTAEHPGPDADPPTIPHLRVPDRADPYGPPEEDAYAPDPEPAVAPSRAPLAATVTALGAGALVAVALGVYGRTHAPTAYAINLAGFSSGLAAKAWLTTAAFALVLVQLWSALVVYGRLPGPDAAEALHRWSGRAAVLLTVPVALHCLYALGFQGGSLRVLVHSLAGCFFYGAFVAKMLVLRARTPVLVLPVLGGAVFTALTALFLTASVWFFTTSGVHL
jgi:hypothetical protein